MLWTLKHSLILVGWLYLILHNETVVPSKFKVLTWIIHSSNLEQFKEQPGSGWNFLYWLVEGTETDPDKNGEKTTWYIFLCISPICHCLKQYTIATFGFGIC